ncbi:MAG: hypothetical protein HC853_07245 [Anaerolineae bacterium]|nr:hypothetical protein [Anaerolineae bacterium]
MDKVQLSGGHNYGLFLCYACFDQAGWASLFLIASGIDSNIVLDLNSHEIICLCQEKMASCIFNACFVRGCRSVLSFFVFEDDPYYATYCSPEKTKAASERAMLIASKLGYVSDRFWAEYYERRPYPGCHRIFVFTTDDSLGDFETRIGKSDLLNGHTRETATAPSSMTEVSFAIARKYKSVPSLVKASQPIQCYSWWLGKVGYSTTALFCTTKGSRWLIDESETEINSDMVFIETSY